jgi:hypothetical protein
MSVADASSPDARAALLRHASCVLAPLAPRTPHSHTLFIYEPLDPGAYSDAIAALSVGLGRIASATRSGSGR